MRRICVGLYSGVVLACQPVERAGPDQASVEERSSYGIPTPAPADVAGECVELAELRVCFGDAPKLVPRPLPESTDQKRFRCVGRSDARLCFDRRTRSDAFVCENGRCRQRHPRLPDNGEWECGDIAGVVACRGHAQAAGTVAGPADPGWICASRAKNPGQRVCLDFSPDLPHLPGPWTCHFEHAPGAAGRVCLRRTSAKVGQDCQASACPAGTRCLDGKCLPPRLATGCWGDQDCEAGRCVLTRCEVSR